MEKLTILQRIGLGFVVLTAVLLGVCAVAWTTLGGIGSRFDDLQKASTQTETLRDFVGEVYELRIAIDNFHVTGSEQARRLVEQESRDLFPYRERMAGLATDFPALRTGLDRIFVNVSAYQAAFDRVVVLEARQTEVLAAVTETGIEARKRIGRLRDEAAARGSPDIAIDAARIEEQTSLGRLRLTRFVIDKNPETATAAGTAFAAAEESLANLQMRASAAGVGSFAADALSQLRETREGFGALVEAVTALEAVYHDDLNRLGPLLQTGAREVLRGVTARSEPLSEAMAVSVTAGRSAMLVAAGVALSLAVALAWVIARWIAGAVTGVAGQMERLAAGDLAIDIAAQATQSNEFGRMARSLAVFRDAQVALKQAEADRVTATRTAAEERRATMARLRDAFGQVVDAGVAGDFGRRVEADFPDAELNALAEAVNRLMESADRGVGAAVEAMETVASGDLGGRMDGRFSGAFTRLQTAIDETVGRLSGVVEEIKGASRDISAAMAGMASDAEDLSSRAESQAASLEETAATMEEISATVRTNAEAARAAAALSQATSEGAESGSAVVARTVDIIARIEESAAKIADITSVIDSIAFQTNLLALNAAVEAARAGEAGKGFAVVAAEVRQLAQRSADAASDIKQLIETSGRQVGEGVAAARQAGRSLDEIVASVRRLDSTIAEITAAGAEQASGVEEISAAVASLDGATQQNAAVAQSTARGAASVTDTARQLESLVGQFRTRSADTARRPRAA